MASVAPPTSLATFNYAHASSSRIPHVSLAPVHGSKSRLAVAAVHGDGIWTYDIRTLKPTTSFTVAPSTVFASAPLSFITQDEDARVTAIGVQGGEAKGGKGEGRALWIWRGEEGDKKTVALESAVQSVHAVDGGWPLLVAHADGSLALLSAELEVSKVSGAKRRKGARVVAAGIAGSRVVVIDDKANVSIYTLDEEAKTVDLGLEGKLTKEAILAADVSAEGVISFIDTANRVHSRRIQDILESANSTQAGVALAHPSTPATIVSLPSETRTLAAIVTPHPTASVAIVAPSATLPAALANVAISSAENTQVTHLAVLARPSETHIVIGTVLSHPGADASGRSVVHVADVTLPTGGVGLALLVGSAARTAEVFANINPTPTTPSNAEHMLNAVTAALKIGEIDRAEQAFATWVEQEDKNAPAGRRAPLPEHIVRRVVDIVFNAALSKAEKPTRTGPYASKIVQTLVERRAVADDMWPGGVALAALVPCSDWKALSRFVRTNPSLPSRIAVSLLALSLAPESTLKLHYILEDILSGPTPDPTYRAELKRQVSGPDAERVLAQLVTWAESHAARGDGLASWPEKPARLDIPPLSAVVTHSSLLLDAHLPSLISMPTAESLMERLQEALAPALAAQADYKRVSAPLDVTLRGSREHEGGKRDVKEAVGKWVVEDFVF